MPIRDLRRKLGLGQSIEVVRAQTRERVNRFRARRVFGNIAPACSDSMGGSNVHHQQAAR